MDCQLFLAQFSEYLDGRAAGEVSEQVEAHRWACPRCRRYSEALETGTKLLRELPTIDLPGDFWPRLEHRIYHLEDGASIARESVGTGATTLSVLAVAALIALSAWVPAAGLVDPPPELPAVVAAEPPPPTFTTPAASSTFTRKLSLFTTEEFVDGIWADSHALFLVYSPISERRRGQAQVRTGIE